MGFALGEILLGLEAYYIRDWYTLQLVSYLPWAILLGLWFIIPESPRWLIAVGEYEKAITVINKMEKVNNATVPKELLDLTAASEKKRRISRSRTNKSRKTDIQEFIYAK